MTVTLSAEMAKETSSLNSTSEGLTFV